MASPVGRRSLIRVATLFALCAPLLMGCSHNGADAEVSQSPVGRGASPAANHTSTPSAAPTPTPLVIPLAVPTHLAVPALGIDADVEEYTDAQVAAAGGWVNPAHRDVVAWWSGGGTPGKPADNTVYLYGHVSSKPAVFNALADVTVGDTIDVTTSAGTLTYRVTDILPPVLKNDLPDLPDVAAAVPGRLVLIGCHRDENQGTKPTTRNLVVIAQQQ